MLDTTGVPVKNCQSAPYILHAAWTLIGQTTEFFRKIRLAILPEIKVRVHLSGYPGSLCEADTDTVVGQAMANPE